MNILCLFNSKSIIVENPIIYFLIFHQVSDQKKGTRGYKCVYVYTCVYYARVCLWGRKRKLVDVMGKFCEEMVWVAEKGRVVVGS